MIIHMVVRGLHFPVSFNFPGPLFRPSRFPEFPQYRRERLRSLEPPKQMERRRRALDPTTLIQPTPLFVELVRRSRQVMILFLCCADVRGVSAGDG